MYKLSDQTAFTHVCLVFIASSEKIFHVWSVDKSMMMVGCVLISVVEVAPVSGS